MARLLEVSNVVLYGVFLLVHVFPKVLKFYEITGVLCLLFLCVCSFFLFVLVFVCAILLMLIVIYLCACYYN